MTTRLAIRKMESNFSARKIDTDIDEMVANAGELFSEKLLYYLYS